MSQDLTRTRTARADAFAIALVALLAAFLVIAVATGEWGTAAIDLSFAVGVIFWRIAARG